MAFSMSIAFGAFGDNDTSFGTNGEVIFFQPSNGYSGWANTVVRQSDGKLVVAGAAQPPPPNQTWILTVRRYNANGTIDTSYGFGGTAISYVAEGGARYAAIQSDGKLLISGETLVNGVGYICVWRFNTNGIYDSTFGTNGRVILGQGNFSGRIEVYKTILNSNTEYILVGYNGVRRLNPNGSLSTSFGIGGGINAASNLFASRSASQFENASIVTADTELNTNVVLRGYSGSGQVNTTFGINGVTSTYYGDFDSIYLSGITRSAQGKYIVGGKYLLYDMSPTDYGFLGSHSSTGVLEFQNQPFEGGYWVSSIRANPDGTLVFRLNGNASLKKFTSNISPLFQATSLACSDLMIQPDSKIVCTSSSKVTRYLQ